MERKGAVVANRVFLLSVLCSQVLVVILAYTLIYMKLIDENSILFLQFLTEIFLVLPAAVYLLLQRKSLKESIGLCKISGKQLLLLIPVAICVDKIAEFFNLLSQLFTENEIGGYMMELVLAYPAVVVFFVVAMEPAICEEVVYRGVVYQGYRRGRILTAALVSAFLFGIMHMNLNQFVYAFAIGIIFALLNEAVGSIVPSILVHMYINGKTVVLLYVVIGMVNTLRSSYTAAELAGDTEKMELLKKAADGIPIESENWLQEYLNSDTGSVSSLLPSAAVWAICACVVLFFLIRALAKSAGREGHLKAIFHSEKASFSAFGNGAAEVAEVCLENTEGEEFRNDTGSLETALEMPAPKKRKLSPLYFVSPALILGVLFCIFVMAHLFDLLFDFIMMSL